MSGHGSHVRGLHDHQLERAMFGVGALVLMASPGGRTRVEALLQT